MNGNWLAGPRLILIDGDVVKDGLIGLCIGATLIVISMISPLMSLGVPRLPMAATPVDQFLYISVYAPIVEEFIFRMVFLAIIWVGATAILMRVGISKKQVVFLGLVFAVLAVSVGFAIYHWKVYGVGLEMAFIGAASFSILACMVALWRNSLVPVILMHFMMNTYILIQRMALITLG